ncbi:hypothetical protein CDAR_393171 [Caerostris darwini]|uniref:Uncharacterized protein n=1 Tax=Caerostris darwini TaxID=1538125 RepID=A0AAV4RWE4_9ARAC|nr:hypothetical protein CDAR_393171 [Caerostris darwini]
MFRFPTRQERWYDKVVFSLRIAYIMCRYIPLLIACLFWLIAEYLRRKPWYILLAAFICYGLALLGGVSTYISLGIYLLDASVSFAERTFYFGIGSYLLFFYKGAPEDPFPDVFPLMERQFESND